MSDHPIGKLSRRGEFSHNVAVARVAEVNLRESYLRAAVAIAYGVLVIGSNSSLWWLTPALCGLVASYLSVRLNLSVLNEEPPRSSLVRAALNSAKGGEDRYTVNMTGLLEGVALIGFATAVSCGVEPVQWRLPALALTLLWAVSQLGATFVDPAFYQSDDDPPAWLEWIRRLVGPMLFALTLVVSYVGHPWPQPWACLPALVALGAFWITWRVNELDRYFKHAFQQSKQSKLQGRKEVVADIHSNISTDLKVATALARELYPDRPDLFEQLVVLRTRLNTTRILEIEPDTNTVSASKSLEEAVARITSEKAAAYTFAGEGVHELAATDVELGWLFLTDLVQNAVDAGTRIVAVEVRRLEPSSIVIDVVDDAGGMDRADFCMPGSSLERLSHLAAARAGSLDLIENRGYTHVRATWRRQMEELT